MLTELSRREKAANIKPDPDVDMYMKVVFDLASVPLICFKSYINLIITYNYLYDLKELIKNVLLIC